MSDDDYERGKADGQADARLDEGDRRHKANIVRFEAIELKLDGILEMMTLVRGGFRLLLAVGATAGAIGAGISSIIRYLTEHWK